MREPVRAVNVAIIRNFSGVYDPIWLASVPGSRAARVITFGYP